MGLRRSSNIVGQFAKRDSLVEKAYPQRLPFTPRSKNSTRRFIYDLSRSHGMIYVETSHLKPKSKENNEDKENIVDNTPAQFIKFELARTIVEEYRLKIAAMRGEKLFQCAICLEDSKVKPTVLHGEYLHAVCAACAPKLTTCPFCRVVL